MSKNPKATPEYIQLTQDTIKPRPSSKEGRGFVFVGSEREVYLLKAANASKRPPVTVLPVSEAVGAALAKIAFLIVAALEPGLVFLCAILKRL